MYGHLNNSFMNEFEPSEFYLSQNYPNPFSERTVIKYCVAVRARVMLTVYNDEGKEIEKLVDEEQNPGTYEVVFQSAVSSQQLASGSYYYRFVAGEYISEKKMQLLNTNR
jgi:hypothetical protein